MLLYGLLKVSYYCTGLFFDLQPMDQTVSIGEDVSFTCQASGVSVPISYRWLFNGVELMSGGRISGENTTNLTIVSVMPSDRGGYSCEATANAGLENITSIEATLSGM